MDLLLDLEKFTRKSKLSPSPSPLAVGSFWFTVLRCVCATFLLGLLIISAGTTFAMAMGPWGI